MCIYLGTLAPLLLTAISLFKSIHIQYTHKALLCRFRVCRRYCRSRHTTQKETNEREKWTKAKAKGKITERLNDNCFECSLSHLYWSHMSEVDLRCSRPIKNNYYSTERVDFGDPNVFYLIYIYLRVIPCVRHTVLTNSHSLPLSRFQLLWLFIHTHILSLSLSCDHRAATLHRYYTIMFCLSLCLLLLINK